MNVSGVVPGVRVTLEIGDELVVTEKLAAWPDGLAKAGAAPSETAAPTSTPSPATIAPNPPRRSLVFPGRVRSVRVAIFLPLAFVSIVVACR